ncbi:MAG: hypothetical protein U1E35_06550 [Rhodospirillales bacterium]
MSRRLRRDHPPRRDRDLGTLDATLNPGGVRIGTAEIYRQVEKLAEVAEALVIGQHWPPGNAADERIVLFVKLIPGAVLDEDLCAHPRGDPAERDAAARAGEDPAGRRYPRTKSGKIVELAVRAVVHGEPVANAEALANPEALAQFHARPELAES